MRSPPLLSPAEINQKLQELEGWKLAGSEIGREFECKTFPQAIQLVALVAELAEAADHHPDIDIRYRKVTFRLSTHSSGGLTHLDTDLAGHINAAIQAL